MAAGLFERRERMRCLELTVLGDGCTMLQNLLSAQWMPCLLRAQEFVGIDLYFSLLVQRQHGYKNC